ncbi:uncharacterized [Tachysurus ichikawai]
MFSGIEDGKKAVRKRESHCRDKTLNIKSTGEDTVWRSQNIERVFSLVPHCMRTGTSEGTQSRRNIDKAKTVQEDK